MNNFNLHYSLRRLSVVAFFVFFTAACGGKKYSAVTVSVSPSASHIPANILRLYVSFSEPMERGQLKEYIYLEDEKGEKLINPFLNLGTELWDEEQTRLTLLFDPGRIKQGVGPNMNFGAPLQEGEYYTLVIRKGIETANGSLLKDGYRKKFLISPAIRQDIIPEDWVINVPETGTRSAMSIEFDRLMDTGAVTTWLRIKKPGKEFVDGKAKTDGTSWSFIPAKPWQTATYKVVIHPALEDVAGNTVQSPFDAKPGTLGRKPEILFLEFFPVESVK